MTYAIHFYAGRGDCDGIEEFLLKGYSIDLRERYGETALHWAVWKRHENAIRLLIEKGALINAKATDGRTPLHVAALNGDEIIAKLLIEKGASVNEKTKSHNTPFDLCNDQLRPILINFYSSYMRTLWSRRAPLLFAGSEQVILTVLLCAKRNRTHLPLEIWQMIFSFMTRRDFALQIDECIMKSNEL